MIDWDGNGKIDPTDIVSMEEIEESGFANYYVDHMIGIWPQAAGDNILILIHDQEVCEPIKFLRAR